MRKSYLHQYGTTMIRNGWPIVPIKEGLKHPGMPGWEQIEATKDDVEQWLANGHAHSGIGILTECLPVIDVDIKNKPIADAALDKLSELMGGRPEYIKVGQAPKFSVMTRLANGAAPFKKMKSAIYLDSDGNEMAIEILAAGQQTVCYAVHPDTGEPYSWPFESIVDATPADLPVYDQKVVDQLFEWFETHCEMHGYNKKSDKSAAAPKRDTTDFMEMAERLKEPVGLTDDQIRKLLPENDDLHYDDWLNVLFAISHECQNDPERGYLMALEWSESSSKHDDNTFDLKWNSIKNDIMRHNPRTMRSYMTKDEEAARKEVAEVKAELRAEQQAEKDQNQDEKLALMVARYALIVSDKTVIDMVAPPGYRDPIKLENFKVEMANVPYFVPTPTQANPGKMKRVNIVDVWLAQPDRMTFAGEKYQPSTTETVISIEHKNRLTGKMERLAYSNCFSFPFFEETEHCPTRSEVLPLNPALLGVTVRVTRQSHVAVTPK